jgi:hypothetical protein
MMTRRSNDLICGHKAIGKGPEEHVALVDIYGCYVHQSPILASNKSEKTTQIRTECEKICDDLVRSRKSLPQGDGVGAKGRTEDILTHRLF